LQVQTWKANSPTGQRTYCVGTSGPQRGNAGINKRIGWHTFRHSYATHLKANGEDIKVVQESLRHANSRITLDTYTQALTPAKREAQSKVVRMILPEQTQTAVAGGGK
jgi:integrase